MNKLGTSFAQKLGPERKAWIRKIDAFMVLLAPLSIAGALFLYQIEIEIRLLQWTFYGALICTPIVAYSLYKETNLSRLERIAIIGLVLCLMLALLVAAVEAGRRA